MIRLRTIGEVSVHIGDKPVPARNELIIEAVLYLVAERGRRIPRREFAELFFPHTDADAAGHSGRNLVYRLRKAGIGVDGDPASIVLTNPVQWDVDDLFARGAATDVELEAFRRGYLADFTHGQSEGFSRWLDEHRSSVTRTLRDVLIRQIQAARAKRDFRTVGLVANACLGLDPLNEEATLAAAESLAAAGAKNDALHVLDQYLDDVGFRSADLRVAPRLLRERISEYLGSTDRESTALIGRVEELATLSALVEQSLSGRAQGGLVSGQAGIGKTRLVEEACTIAALSGHAVVHVRLTRPDVDRPFAILRDLGPTVLDLPGALGAAPETLAAVRGLCGRGPAQYTRRPANAYDARAVAADIQQKLIDLIGAVAEELPLVIRIEDADYLDEASLELIEQLLAVGRRICVLMASRIPVILQDRLSLGPAVSRIQLPPLGADESNALVRELFAQSGRKVDAVFAENAVRVSAGVPLFLHLLFKNFLVTDDPTGLPSTLAASLTARLDHLEEPAKGVLDVVVILSGLSTVRRIEQVTELPRYSLAQAFRTLEEQGFLRFAEGAVLPSHDLLAEASRRRMPTSVRQLLHRTVATILEEDASPDVDPLEIAIHWKASEENARAIQVLIDSARRSVELGRPRQAITLLQRATGWATETSERMAVDTSLVEACHAAGEDHLGFAAAERIDGLAATSRIEIQLMGIEMAVGAGKALVPFRQNLEVIAADLTLDASLRARSARLLIMIAEDIGDATIGMATLRLIDDISVLSAETITPRLIFETVFGSRDKAIELANRLLQSVRGSRARGAALLLAPGENWTLRRLKMGHGFVGRRRAG